MSRLQDHHRQAVMEVIGDMSQMKAHFGPDKELAEILNETVLILQDFALHEDEFEIIDASVKVKNQLRRRGALCAYMSNAVGRVEFVRHPRHPGIVGISVKVKLWTDQSVVSHEEHHAFDDCVIAAGVELGWDVRSPQMRSIDEQKFEADPLARVEIEAEIEDFRAALDAWSPS